MSSQDLKINITDPSSTEKLIEIEIPRSNFDSIYNEKVKKYSKELRLNGYRKGTIPKRIISERFNEPLTNETLEKLVDDVIKEACRSHNIIPVAPGKVEELKNESEKPIFLKAKVEVDQQVDITNYQNLGIKIGKAEKVTDNDVEAEINKHIGGFATEEPREVGQKGNIVLGEYLSISINGEDTPLPEEKSFRIEIGLDKIPEFNKAFVGSKVGEEIEITVNHSDNYENKELAGKAGLYKIKISSIFEKVSPPVDDELAKKFGAADLHDLREKIKDNLSATRESEIKLQAEKEAIEKIIAGSPFDIPRARIDQYIEYQLHGHEQHQHGESHEHHHHDIPPAQKKIMEEQASFVLKKFRILEIVGAKEKIKPKQEQVDEKIKEMALRSGMDFDTLKASLRKTGRINEIREELKAQLAMDFILKN